MLLFRPPMGVIFSAMEEDAATALAGVLMPFLPGARALHAPKSLTAVLRSRLGLGAVSYETQLWAAKEARAPAEAFDRVKPCECDGVVAELSGVALALERGSMSLGALQRWAEQSGLYVRRNVQGHAVALIAHTRDSVAGACIGFLFTDPRYRRRGHARVMVTSLTRSLLGAGHACVFVQVRADNEAARALYRGVGYEEVLSYSSWSLGLESRVFRESGRPVGVHGDDELDFI